MAAELKKLAENRPLRVVGLMSGTSMDGVDAAWVETNGETVATFGPSHALSYPSAFRARLHKFVSSVPDKDHGDAAALDAELTDFHAAAVKALIAEVGAAPDLVGFHGQTIWHRPHARQTWQMGDGQRLAQALNVPVVYDFRSNDVAHGGQGAPLLPLFHVALASALPKPLGVLNIGGVSNVTWIGDRKAQANGHAFPFAILGFDTGPGNAMMDDWMLKHTGRAMDENGAMARAGSVDATRLAKLMASPFIREAPPKSLDRLAFDASVLDGLSVADGAATMAEFTAATVAAALAHCPSPPHQLLVTGGGRHNPVLMERVAALTRIPVAPVEAAGWNGDMMEAQGFAYFAARLVRGLPLTYPDVTGAPTPLPGGVLVHPR